MAKKSIYLDCAAGTPLGAAAKKAASEGVALFANPSGLHENGIAVRQKIEEARRVTAELIGAVAEEIIFTASGTESNNLAIRGLVEQAKDPHIVTTNIEHPSVLETCRGFASRGVSVTFVPVLQNGIVSPKKIREALRPNTLLVSVAYANNEIGTIQPISEIAKMIRSFRKEKEGVMPYFHTDAVQAFNYLPTDIRDLGVDLLTLNGSKIYGPRGIGILYKGKNIPLRSILFGGNQEKGLRPGTENTPAILGFAAAAAEAFALREKEAARLVKLREFFLDELKNSGLPFILNGDRRERLPNNVNISLGVLTGDIWVIELSARGIAVSSKSACKEGQDEDSYVVSAIGGMGKSSLRFSFGRTTKKSDLIFTVAALRDIFDKYKEANMVK